MARRVEYRPGDRGPKGSLLVYQHDVEPHRSPNGRPHRRALFLCDCGNTKVALVSHWRQGTGGVRSCGCLDTKGTRHGMYGTPIYERWAQMIQRSTPGRIRPASYANVGHDPRWDDFVVFYADMGDDWWSARTRWPTAKLVLGRHGDTGDYKPGNCRFIPDWLNTIEMHEAQGHTVHRDSTGYPYVRVANEHGISTSTYRDRVDSGWPPERAATEPVRAKAAAQ